MPEPEELHPKSLLIRQAQEGKGFEQRQHNPIPAVSAIWQGVGISQEHCALAAQLAQIHQSPLVKFLDKLLGSSQMTDALGRAIEEEVQGSGLEPPHQLIARADHRAIIPARGRKFSLQLRERGFGLSAQVSGQHRSLLLMGVYQGRAATQQDCREQRGKSGNAEEGYFQA